MNVRPQDDEITKFGVNKSYKIDLKSSKRYIMPLDCIFRNQKNQQLHKFKEFGNDYECLNQAKIYLKSNLCVTETLAAMMGFLKGQLKKFKIGVLNHPIFQHYKSHVEQSPMIISIILNVLSFNMSITKKMKKINFYKEFQTRNFDGTIINLENEIKQIQLKLINLNKRYKKSK